jgi:sec-independent protein translocase protein TatB
MFNIGMGELFFIVLLALVVVGPERLPKIMREFGRFVRQIRLFVNEFTSQFGDELQTIQELQQPLQELQQLASDINPVKQVTKIAVDLDAKADADVVPQTTDSGATSSQPTLVKPSAAFRSPPPKATSNPMKIIARSKKTGEPLPPAVPSHDR